MRAKLLKPASGVIAAVEILPQKDVAKGHKLMYNSFVSEERAGEISAHIAFDLPTIPAAPAGAAKRVFNQIRE